MSCVTTQCDKLALTKSERELRPHERIVGLFGLVSLNLIGNI
jgi:hypothetical protein